MPDIRFNPITGDPVIISTARAERPGAWSDDSSPGRATCPFCPGHESETPPEVERLGGFEWTARVVPNKYPAIDRQPETTHEVVVDSREHDQRFEAMSIRQASESVALWQKRARALGVPDSCRYVSVFRNEGPGAGQSIPHPHSQILALDFIPPRIVREMNGFAAGSCPLCGIATLDPDGSDLLVDRAESMLLVVPPAPRMPFEMWLMPSEHRSDWTTADPDELARILLSAVRRLRALHVDAPFNIGVITAPLRVEAAERFHWYVEVVPRLTNLAGYEMSSGGWINIEAPERAAKMLRECSVRQD